MTIHDKKITEEFVKGSKRATYEGPTTDNLESCGDKPEVEPQTCSFNCPYYVEDQHFWNRHPNDIIICASLLWIWVK